MAAPQQQQHTGSVGAIGPFDPQQEDWSSYSERLEQYFIINNIGGDMRVPALISLIGGETYKLLRKLTAPAKPAEKSFQQLIDILQQHLSPQPLVIAERFRFHKRDQRPSEPINAYVAELRQLAKHCDFGEYLEQALRDRFVCGLKQESIQRKLLAEARLTLQKAVETAVAMEMAAQDTEQLRKPISVHKLQKASTKPCPRCGKSGHTSDKCRFRDAECHGCGKVGHIRSACRSSKDKPKRKQRDGGKFRKAGQKNVHAVETHSTSEDEEGISKIVVVENIGNSLKSSPIYISPEINGQPMQMELDTGAAVSVMPKSAFDKIKPQPKLKPTSVKLKTFSEELLKPLGVARVNVEIDGQSATLDLYVTKTGTNPLFGRSWLRHIKINWSVIKQLHTASLSVQDEIRELLTKYDSVFKDEMGELKGMEARLPLKETAIPKFCRARQVPYAMREKVGKELDRLEAEGIITKVAHSDWATPIVPVMKPNGSVRLCGDYKVTINPVLEVEQYPLPRIQDIFANLAGGQKFTKIDLKQAYHQMKLEEKSRKLLTINTHKGLYEYNRLVFGVSSAPAIWQRTMEQVLQGIPNTQCMLDDMIITGKTDQEHLENLAQVLERIDEFGLRANLKKCEFFKDEIVFCGHKIDKNGLHKTEDKVKCMTEAERPTNISQLRSFLGLVNYYHRFLPNLATVIHPLNALLGKDRKWKWDETCENAFKNAKKMIASEQVLVHYNPELPLSLATDASPYGLGAVLSHTMPDGNDRPIAFASRSLNSAERNYAQIDKEALAIVWGVKHFYMYLYGRKFTMITDHQPLVSIFNPKKGIPAMTAARLQRYALFLAGLAYDIEYRNTHRHGNADGLSRLPIKENGEPNSSDTLGIKHLEEMAHPPVTSAQVSTETRRDTQMSLVYEHIEKGWKSNPPRDQSSYYHRRNELSLCQGCIMWGHRVVIPDKLRKKVLTELHSGHVGVVKMKALARSYVWWPNIDKDIEAMAKSCAGCRATQKSPPLAPLHPWEWPAEKWQRVHIDYAGPIDGYMLLVVVDAYSKWPEVAVTKSTTSERTIDLLRAIFARNGVPEQLVSDNGPQFTSAEFKDFVTRNGMKHITSAPFHPSSNGLAERFVQSLKSSLHSMRGEKGTLRRKVFQYLMAYRNAPHATTGESPSVLLNNRSLRSRLDLLKPDRRKRVNNKQTKMAASRHNTIVRQFEEGDAVWVRDYREGGNKWISGTINSRSGPLSYQVNVAPNLTWRRHVDQMTSGTSQHTPEPESATQPDVTMTTEVNEARPPTATAPTTTQSEETTPILRRSGRQRRPPDRLNL
ncbi:uncharacterized protein K02A2.6-like [Lytechinus variegatus]|uniref:uncharacterized protein K02A2.6-like n=1 Tax=Lytechinus variegatus TaxID=7654 RepID=UPI001BB28D1A|nr:uncharacterized protein K02A2.6-like [Lytechinus variegatus]